MKRSGLVFGLMVALGAAVESNAWQTADSEAAQALQGAASVIFEPDGDVISGGLLGVDQIVIRRHAAGTGTELWRIAFTGITSTSDGISFAHDASGHLLVAMTRFFEENALLGTVLKIDPATGTAIWQRDVADARFSDIAIDQWGDVAAVGMLGSWTGPKDTFAIKLSGQTGEEMWRFQLAGDWPYYNRLTSVVRVPGGGFYVGGTFAKPRPDRSAGDPGFSVLRLKNTNGQIRWWTEIGDNGGVQDIALAPGGDVVAVGFTSIFDTLAAVKLAAADGALIWRADTPRPVFASVDERADALVVDSVGDVFVAGSMKDPAWPGHGSTTAVTTLKISGATGDVLWRHDLSNADTSGGNCCRRRDIELDPDGNPVIFGIFGTHFWQESVVAKLDSVSGTSLWRTDPGTEAPLIGKVEVGNDGSVALASSRWSCRGSQCGSYTVEKLRGETGLGYFGGCGDEIDNDGDGAIDYPDDLGCASESHPLENPACQNGEDDDADGRTDFPADLGCAGPSAATESPACEDGIDNDADGAIDYLADPGCDLPSRDDESPACQDGIDNDGDGLTDHPGDPGCEKPSAVTESPQCDDGVDNDQDGLVDHPVDPGCAFSWSVRENPACQDGVDNDGDGTIDFDGGVTAALVWNPIRDPDPDCVRPHFEREHARPPGCGLGSELAAAVPLLVGLRRLRRRATA